MTDVNNMLKHILSTNLARATIVLNLFQARWVYETPVCKTGTYKISREPSVGNRCIEDDAGKIIGLSSVSLVRLVEY